MDVAQIVEAIKQRRDQFWDRQTLGTSSDPPVYSEAELARAIADEYDSLLIQLGVITPRTSQERMSHFAWRMLGGAKRVLY
jgi:hypothetical protein